MYVLEQAFSKVTMKFFPVNIYIQIIISLCDKQINFERWTSLSVINLLQNLTKLMFSKQRFQTGQLVSFKTQSHPSQQLTQFSFQLTAKETATKSVFVAFFLPTLTSLQLMKLFSFTNKFIFVKTK